MINDNTPYKLAEIIRDTWPNLYYLRRTDNASDKDNYQGCQGAPRQYQ